MLSIRYFVYPTMERRDTQERVLFYYTQPTVHIGTILYAHMQDGRIRKYGIQGVPPQGFTRHVKSIDYMTYDY